MFRATITHNINLGRETIVTLVQNVQDSKQSFGQDMINAVSNGKFKTPKSIIFPQAIKTLTKNTELTSITNKLGHGVCYSILQELATENACRFSNQQESGVILPDGTQQETFTICVADNIDRLEKTLSSLYNCFVFQFFCYSDGLSLK